MSRRERSRATRGDDAGRPRAKGPNGFEAYYGELFGPRWSLLRAALLEAGASVALSSGLARSYYLDPASVIAALALGVRDGDEVLDLCAAPGGKSLVLASRLVTAGRLVANERSSARRARLHRVLDDHLTAAIRARVTVTGHDAARWGLYEPQSYDRVLADVPCSSEEHVIRSPAALAEWSETRTKRLAQAAYAIGCAALDAARPGGTVVYSTCALSPSENDGVVARLLDRSGSSVTAADARGIVTSILRNPPPELSTLPIDTLPGTPTEHGWTFLPDADGGLGPIYFAILTRSA